MTSRCLVVIGVLLFSATDARADALPGPRHRDACEALPKDAACHLLDGREGRCDGKKSCVLATPSAIPAASVSAVAPPEGPSAAPSATPAPVKRGCATSPDGTSSVVPLLLAVVVALGRRRSRV